MKTIWKYPIKLSDTPTTIAIPHGGKVVMVAMQGAQPTLWVEVEPSNEAEARCFAVHGTGHPISESRVHVGSFQSPPFVWHVVECTEAR